MKKPQLSEPSLFDELEDAPAPPSTEQDYIDLPRSTWREVPQALFDSWSVLRQLAYCRERDMDGALYAPNDEEALWFKRRADSYTNQMKEYL
jgi:hypothetical protein